MNYNNGVKLMEHDQRMVRSRKKHESPYCTLYVEVLCAYTSISALAYGDCCTSSLCHYIRETTGQVHITHLRDAAAKVTSRRICILPCANLTLNEYSSQKCFHFTLNIRFCRSVLKIYILRN